MLASRRCSLSLVVHGRTATARASTRDSATNCSTAKSSTQSRRRKSSSKNGESTTTPSGRTAPWVIARRRPKASFRCSKGRPCTKNQTGPLNGGLPQELSKTHEIVSRSKTELWHRILTHYLPLYFPEAERFHRSSRTDWFLAFLEK